MDPPATSRGGTMVLGPYAVAMRRGEARRRRRMVAATSLFALVLVVGLGSIWVGADFGGQRSGAEPGAALLVPPAPSPLAPGTMFPDPAGPGEAGQADRVAPSRPPVEPDPESEPEPEPETAVETAAETAVETAAAATLRTDEGAGLMTASVIDDLGPLADDPGSATDETNETPETPVRRGGWVCEGGVQVQDPLGRDWSLGRVSFTAEPGFERVVLHLARVSGGSGAPPSVSAEVVPTSRLRSVAPGVRRSSAGPTTVSLLLEDGIKVNLGLRGYRPRGLVAIKEFSVYPAPRGSSRVLVSTTADTCFRLRVPAWSVAGAHTSEARVILDVRP